MGRKTRKRSPQLMVGGLVGPCWGLDQADRATPSAALRPPTEIPRRMGIHLLGILHLSGFFEMPHIGTHAPRKLVILSNQVLDRGSPALPPTPRCTVPAPPRSASQTWSRRPGTARAAAAHPARSRGQSEAAALAPRTGCNSHEEWRAAGIEKSTYCVEDDMK